MPWLTALAALCFGCAGCIVQGGEENGRQSDFRAVGVVQFEATNQDGEVVGSGCTVDSPEYYHRIRFRGRPGDKIELSEQFRLVPGDTNSLRDHENEPDYWCSQSGTARYSQVLDGRCWKAVEPAESESCADEASLVARVESFTFIPESTQPAAGKLDGFKLSLEVVGVGKQCIDMRCADRDPSRQQLAFVVE